MSGVAKGVLSFGTAAILTVAFYVLESEVRQAQAPTILAEPTAPVTLAIETRTDNPGFSSYPGLYKPSELRTFRGAEEVSGLRLKNGHLVVDKTLRDWMDFHRAALGELTLEEITDNLYTMAASLPSPADEEATKIITTYLEYLTALGDYDEIAARQTDLTTLQQLQARQEWLERTRGYYFTDEVHEAFFGMDEAIDRNMLSELILKSQGADDAEIAALDDQLPEKIQAFRHRSRSVVRLNEMEAELHANGTADAESLWQLRAREFGDDAADRLAEADLRQQAWENRVQEYMAFTTSDQLQTLSLQDQETAIAEYHSANFSEREILRLPAAVTVLTSR